MSIREELVGQLQHDIITGVFQPGQRIIERELIERFGVSSIPVREALQDLEGRGSLVRKVNHGYTVVQLTNEEAQRICELRQLLEPAVVAWATARMTEQGLAEPEERLAEIDAMARSGDMAAFFMQICGFTGHCGRHPETSMRGRRGRHLWERFSLPGWRGASGTRRREKRERSTA